MRNQGFNAEEYRFFLHLDFHRRAFPFILLLAIAFIGLALFNKSQFGNPAIGWIDAALALVLMGLSGLLRWQRIAPMVAMVLALTLLIFHVGLTIVTSGTMHGVLFYYCVLPFVAFYMIGARVGLIMSGILLLLSFTAFIMSLGGFAEFGYSTVELGYFLFLLCFSIAAAWLFESIREKTLHSVYREGIRYNILMEAIDEVYYRVGLDGLIQELGEAIIALTGWHPDEVVGRHIEMFYADASQRHAYVQALKEKGSVKNYPIAILGKQGQRVMISMSSRIVVNEAGKPQYIEGMFRDITKEVTLDQERQKHLDHVQTLSQIDTMLAGGDMELGIRQTLTQLLKIFGVQRAFLVPMPNKNKQMFADAFFAADPAFSNFELGTFLSHQEVVQALASLPVPSAQQPMISEDIHLFSEPLLQRYQIQAQSITLIALNSRSVWVLWLQHCEQDVAAFTQHKLLIDIAYHLRGALAQMSLQRSLQKTALRAEKASKAKSVFLATMSHELRTPLHGVIGLLDLLAGEQDNLSAEQRGNLKLALSSARVLSALIDDILDLSKIESGHVHMQNHAFNLEKTIREALISFVVRAREKRLQLSFAMINVAETIEGDASLLRQVLLNLVGNAVKFTTKGYVRIVVTQDESHLLIDIEDSGIGMDEKKQALVFQPFMQVHDIQILGGNLQEKGTGLGTTIAQRFVEIMGGSIRLRSIPKLGTTMSISLPLRQVGNQRVTVSRWLEDLLSSEQSFSEDSASGPGHISAQTDETIRDMAISILLAEDDPVGRLVAFKRLQRAGFTVTLAASGESAWQTIQRKDFDVLLTDVRMPGLNGIALTHKVRAREKEKGKAPMIIMGLSAYALEEVKHEALQSGMDIFITKPVDMQALMKTLKERYLVNIQHD